MARRPQGTNTNPYQLLLHVPKRAIVARLLENPTELPALTVAYQSLVGGAAQPTRANLFGRSVQDLVRIFEVSTATTEEHARALHDDWRYRGLKAVFLYRLAGGHVVAQGMGDRLNDALANIATDDATEDVRPFNEQFRFDLVDGFQIQGGAVVECRYSYAAPIDYVDPADEDAKVVADLRNGFAWLCEAHAWAAISATDLDTRDRIAACLSDATGATLMPIRFTKEIISSLEPDAHRRRVALVDQQTHTTRRYTGQRLGSDQVASREIQARWRQDDAPFSGYTVSVDQQTEMVLGYNSRQGKVFFSKDLTADQLRAWLPAKLLDILNAVETVVRRAPALTANIAEAQFRGINQRSRAAAAELAAAVAACKQGNVSEQPLQRDAIALLGELQGLVNLLLYALDEGSEEVATLCCTACERENLRLNDDASALICGSCDHLQNRRRLGVVGGGSLDVRNLSDITQLVPNTNLLEAVLNAAAVVTGMPSNPDEEFFYVRGNVLTYRRATGNVVLTIDQIPELAALMAGPPTAQRRTVIQQALPLFKEKCNKISTRHCAGCVANRVGPKCYLRLFGLFDDEFTPQPHGAMEYGDYARRVTIDNVPDQYLVVLMKRKPKSKGAITSSSKEGREILEQAFKYFQDASAQAIGVSVPHLIHDNLKKLLVHLARSHGKKLVFFDTETLTRVISTVVTQNGVSLAQI